MIKRTLCFSHPAWLSVCNKQLIIKIPGMDQTDLPPSHKKLATTTIPIEDIGIIILDHQQITITHNVFEELLNNNAAIISCNNQHLPTGLLLPLSGNTTQSERFQNQISASLPLKKQLWQQTISQKIINQAAILHTTRNTEIQCMLKWAQNVKSGDPDNLEGRAAAYYWPRLMNHQPNWTRSREGDWPNPILNYGYAILRAIVARSLVASGMLPTLGIHHHNRYNAYCLADDIMEPYRPYIDQLVIKLIHNYPSTTEITIGLKKQLLAIPILDVIINGKRSPLMVAVSQTTASLYKCFNGEIRKISYPSISI